MAELEGTLKQENEDMKKELAELRAAHADCDALRESNSAEITSLKEALEKLELTGGESAQKEKAEMEDQLSEMKKQLEMETSAKRDFKAESEDQEKELTKL